MWFAGLLPQLLLGSVVERGGMGHVAGFVCARWT
jgi:hypothetical protein